MDKIKVLLRYPLYEPTAKSLMGTMILKDLYEENIDCEVLPVPTSGFPRVHSYGSKWDKIIQNKTLPVNLNVHDLMSRYDVSVSIGNWENLWSYGHQSIMQMYVSPNGMGPPDSYLGLGNCTIKTVFDNILFRNISKDLTPISNVSLEKPYKLHTWNDSIYPLNLDLIQADINEFERVIIYCPLQYIPATTLQTLLSNIKHDSGVIDVVADSLTMSEYAWLLSNSINYDKANITLVDYIKNIWDFKCSA